MNEHLFKPTAGMNFVSPPSTLVELLQWRAKHQPNQQAYTFLLDGETEEAHLTYEELDQQARAIGSWLQSLGVTEQRVLLLYPPGLEYVAAFFGCLYGGNIAVPAYPPRLKRPMPRLQAIVASARPVIALTTTSILSNLERRFAHSPALKALRWLTIDNIPEGVETDWQAPPITSDTLASLQYTSGSTGTPRGVMVSHGNFMHNLDLIHHGFKNNHKDRGVFWLPLYHDMGLGSILEPLYIGACSILMSPVAFLQRPVRWLQAITRYKGTISGGPNFAYDLCVDKITPEQRETLDLSSWKLAFCGAEPIRYKTLERFTETFEACGFRREAFYPCYGLAEATLIVSGGLGPTRPVVRTVQQAALEQNRVVDASSGEIDALSFVSCGQTLLDQKITIVHPETLTKCQPDQVGEIWVSGPSVTQGYWRQPEETQQTFQAYLSDTDAGPFLRTGDLGFLQDGKLFVTGRLKDLIIIRGRNYYPQDIELTVEQSHPALRPGCGAAFSVEVAGEERLAIVQEVERHYRQPDVEEIAGAIRQAVVENHGLAVYAVTLIKSLSIPKTTSGKIKRYACRADFLAGNLKVVGEWQATITTPAFEEQDVTEDRMLVDVQANSRTVVEIQTWLVSQISKRLGIDADDIDIRQSFDYYGLDSVQVINLSGDLGEWLGIPLSPTLVYEYPTIETLARYLATVSGETPGVSELSSQTISTSEPEHTATEAIAIVGLACRFPGARDADTFWQLLCDGVDAITEVPRERWNLSVFYDPDPAISGKMNTRWGGFLDGIDQFDARFFGISPREASRMDPQHRLLLEIAWEALEDAGQRPDDLIGTNTGVFIGISGNDYGQTQLGRFASIDAYTGTGNALSIAANRLSFMFGFQGPSMAVDTACSSSLVAVHLACQSLWRGEATMALAGGVNLILSPAITINFSKAGLMAPDGRCKTFDARADGYVRSEGAGLVVLKPLAQALADGDPIYAVIRGSAVNQDGRTNGLMAPSRQAQEAVLRTAYERSGISPGQIQYVETHGTGTLLGDIIEAQALGAVLSTGRDPKNPCAIGSVKTNIGHLEAAAGIAGLIKVALSLKHCTLPPSLHFQEPNPHIPFAELSLRVQQSLSEWPVHSSPALAGVGSFGFGGTNAHVVLEQAPAESEKNKHEELERGDAQLLPLSARSLEALPALAGAYADFLGAETAKSSVSLPDVCYTASVRRNHHDYRLALLGRSPTELIEHLNAFLQRKGHLDLPSAHKTTAQPRKPVFVFPGQGGQWLGMGQELLAQEPVFRATLEQCDQAMQPYIDWSLRAELTAPEDQSQLTQIDVVQPVLFSIQIALTELWRSWGIEPEVVVGHSMGEVAAAYVAGALRLTDAARIICLRSQLLRRVSGQGAMVVVELSVEQAQEYLAGYEDQVSIAVSNSPRSTVLSGEPSALQEITATLEHQGIFHRPVQVDVASHSSQIDPLRDDLLQLLAEVKPQTASLPIYSTVTGQISDGLECNAEYWVRNLREPVLFSTVIQRLVEQGYDTFLDISPHPILSSALKECLRHSGRKGVVLPSIQREAEKVVMLKTLGELYTLGQPVNWSRLYPSGGKCVRLPAYPWQRERFWLDDQGTGHDLIQQTPVISNKVRTGHPLLGQHLKSALDSGTHFWQMELGLEQFPYLAGHRIQGEVLLPAAAYLEISLAALQQAFGAGTYTLEQVKFKKPFLLPERETRTGQLVISADMPGTASFQFFSLEVNRQTKKEFWNSHVTGMIRFDQPDDMASSAEQISLEEIRTRCQDIISGTEFYQVGQAWGFQYGPDFRIAEQIWRRDGEAIAQLRLTAASEMDDHGRATLLIDACFQVLMATLSESDSQLAKGDTYVVAGLEHLQSRDHFLADPELWGYALLRSDIETNIDLITGDVFLLNQRGQVMLEAQGLSIQRVGRDKRQARSDDLDDWLYEIQWQPLALESGSEEKSKGGSWLIFADSSGVGHALQTLLTERGETCVMVSPGQKYSLVRPGHYQLNPACPEDFRQLLEEVIVRNGQPLCRGVVHLWSFDIAPPEETTLTSLAAAQELSCGSVLHLVQALAQIDWSDVPRLWLATRGAQAVGANIDAISIAQSPLWGFGRVIIHEHPEFRCTNVDFEPIPTPHTAEQLCQELEADGQEDQIAWRDDKRYVARLVQCSVEANLAKFPRATQDEKGVELLPADRGFRLEITSPGILDNLMLRMTSRRKPGPGEVEIQVYTAGLNFLDVLSALGARPDLPADCPIELGGECAGKVVAVGKGVKSFQIGDEVIAVAPASFSSFVITPEAFVIPKPARLSFEEAATLPIAFTTAYYALYELGKLSKSERVCIHSATGGVGLAAVQLAQQVGAEIFATAGNPEKREFLRSLGIQHVMDSRSLTFADEVLAITKGQGVDVVLNTLTGEAMAKSLSMLAPFGRFLEISKRDIYQNSQVGLSPFQKNLSYFAIDLARMMRERPAFFGSLLREVGQQVDNGVFKPLPWQTFPVSQAVDAFRYMAQAKHIGKIVLSLPDQAASVVSPGDEKAMFRTDGTYLITGGLGSLGLMVAQWMVEQGARHLVLVGRRDVSATAQEMAANLQEQGATIEIVKADVSQAEQVADMLAEIEQNLPPLRGVIHAAGVLDDGILLRLDQERFKRVMAPKVEGAWNLHNLTIEKPLDFFVLFSSLASLLGSPGQSNYAAANTFLDTLAHYRRVQDLPALSINWGPWSEVGLAARQTNGGKRLVFQELKGITPAQGLTLLGRLLFQEVAQIGVIPFNMRQWRQHYSTVADSPLLAQLLGQEQISSARPVNGFMRENLLAAKVPQRRVLLETYLREQTAQVLWLSLSQVDPGIPLSSLGVDSLMALELRNRLERDLGLTLSATLIWNYPTINNLIPYLADQMAIPLADELPSSPVSQEDNVEQIRLLTKLEQISEEEAEALLTEKLERLSKKV